MTNDNTMRREAPAWLDEARGDRLERFANTAVDGRYPTDEECDAFEKKLLVEQSRDAEIDEQYEEDMAHSNFIGE